MDGSESILDDNSFAPRFSYRHVAVERTTDQGSSTHNVIAKPSSALTDRFFIDHSYATFGETMLLRQHDVEFAINDSKHSNSSMF